VVSSERRPDASDPHDAIGGSGAAAGELVSARSGPRAVERPTIVAVTGAHSTGKSTFLARLAHALRNDGLEVATVADLGEQAQQIGLPILHSHTWASTLWIMARGIANEIATWPHCDVLLVDRPVPDALGYYRAALAYRGERPDPGIYADLVALASGYAVHYDLIFRTELDTDLPLGTNKVRDRNQRFRVLADHYIRGVLTDLAIPHRSLPIHEHDTAIAFAREFISDNDSLPTIVTRQ
jgi:hypothetical protein